MTLVEFLNSPYRNLWLNEPYIDIYVRKSIRMIPEIGLRETFDIANIEVLESKRGTGVFTRFLQRAENEVKKLNMTIFVESILEVRLVSFLERRGYQKIKIDSCLPNFYKTP